MERIHFVAAIKKLFAAYPAEIRIAFQEHAEDLAAMTPLGYPAVIAMMQSLAMAMKPPAQLPLAPPPLQLSSQEDATHPEDI